MKNVLIIDYGTGNLKSVHNAIKKVTEKQDCKILVSSSIEDLKKIDSYYFAWSWGI